ncbi:MAG: hypothetical protein PCFJNLEI_01862 [Verrucomicrobiae bacterium]|nr:hypothetical protein [Verrucomicrobiae bacterium]
MAKETRATVSVVIPAYNCARFLAQAVESVLAQTCPPTEVIVVDDGSTDDTAEVAASFGTRIHLIRQPNRGPAVARNTGIEAAQGEWIAFLDSDDVWFPDKLERQVAALQPGGLLCGEVLVFSGMDLPTPPARQPSPITEVPFERLLQRNWIATSTVVVPRSALVEVGGFNKRYRGPEDFDCWLSLAYRGVPVRKMMTPVAGYRIIPQSLSQQVERMRDQELEIVSHWSRLKGRSLSTQICRQAMAGVHYRAGIGHAETNQRFSTICSVFHSITISPRKLPEYSQFISFPRLRLLARCLLSPSTICSV